VLLNDRVESAVLATYPELAEAPSVALATGKAPMRFEAKPASKAIKARPVKAIKDAVS
jgi:hypothetical protein